MLVNFDRDLSWFDIGISSLPYLSAEQGWSIDTNVVTNSTIPSTYNSAYYYLASDTQFTNQYVTRSAGLNIKGPDETGGSPYRIKGFIALHSNDGYIIRLMCGVGSSAPISGIAGSIVVKGMPLSEGRNYIDIDQTIYIQPFDTLFPGQGYSNRPITFYAQFYRYTGPSNAICVFNLSVQRLATKPPTYSTANR